ncbi:MAG: hypothetical protein AAB610_00510 [Patescibacteria group bacterium]
MKSNAHNKSVAVHIATRSPSLRTAIERVVMNAMGEDGVTFVPSPHESQAIVVLFEKDVQFSLKLNNPFEVVRHQVVFLSESKRELRHPVTRVGMLDRRGLNQALLAA